MMPCAQPRLSLLTIANITVGRTCEALIKPTMNGRLVPVKDYHASLSDSTITPPKHTYPTCEHCPGCLPGYHYCKESGRVVRQCEDCEISITPIPLEPATTSTPAAKAVVPQPGSTTAVTTPASGTQGAISTTLDTTTKTVTATKYTSMHTSALHAAAALKREGGGGPPTTTEAITGSTYTNPRVGVTTSGPGISAPVVSHTNTVAQPPGANPANLLLANQIGGLTSNPDFLNMVTHSLAQQGLEIKLPQGKSPQEP